MPRYVILEHDSPRGRHWDLMLEWGESLRTWALPSPPDSPGPQTAPALADHRAAYLDYEGPISGDRGSVTRWDWGTYELLLQADDRLAVQFRGQRLAGPGEFRRAPQPDAWHIALPH